MAEPAAPEPTAAPRLTMGPTMQKAISDFLFGLFFGIGFIVAANVLAFIVSMLGGHPVQLHG
jgi:hypothetical protein